MADGYAIKHIDEFEEMEGSGGVTWRLARRTLGAEAFGFNVVEIAPGGELPAHDESESGQEEVFAVLDGEATIVADDSEHRAGPGTFVRYGREVKRTVRNRSDAPIRVLLIGVPGDSGYEPLSWA
ncbi:MAG: cupin domain-containing protein [Actinomycetota bacterium]|nr:cupin domain-containing protein [Actinomycetota bacterium]